MGRDHKGILQVSLSSNRAWELAGDVTRVFPQAEAIGSGFFRTAYRLGRYVIKSASAHNRRGYTPVKRLRRAGLVPPQQWYTNGWVVQPYYKLAFAKLIDEFIEENMDLLNDSDWVRKSLKALDLGYGNTGIDEKGRLVAFDW